MNQQTRRAQSRKVDRLVFKMTPIQSPKAQARGLAHKNLAASRMYSCQRVEDNALPLVFQEREKFGTCPGVVFKSAQKTGGLHDRVLFLNAPHHHAKMFRFDDDGHTGRLKTIHERLGDLCGKILLDLQTARVDIDDAGDLGEANDFSIWNVGHMRAANEREQMMLA
jgi:hypothetical protein